MAESSAPGRARGTHSEAPEKPRRTFVKLCGLTRLAEVEAAVRLGADAVGFVLAKDARLPLEADEAARLAAPLRGTSTLSVAVVGRVSLEAAERIAALGFDVLQAVYDPASPLPPVVGPALVLPVLFDRDSAVEAAAEIRALVPLDGTSIGRLLCLDGGGGGQRGERPSFARAAEIAREVPLLLAGGLTPENVGDAIAEVGPRGVDVSSGISGPEGRKDLGRMSAFVAAVRDAC